MSSGCCQLDGQHNAAATLTCLHHCASGQQKATIVNNAAACNPMQPMLLLPLMRKSPCMQGLSSQPLSSNGTRLATPLMPDIT